MLTLTSEHARYPLKCRHDTSDLAVFEQVFVEREYSCLDDVVGAGLVIDCGAYVGYSSAYFLTRFPGCQVIAIEPEPRNFELLRENLSPYGARATILRAAVWSHAARLTLSEARYRDGRLWATQVRECGAGEIPTVTATDIGTLLRGSGYRRITILKVDVEGAERHIFSANFEPWIECVDHLVIEIHDDSNFGECTSIFERAVAGRGLRLGRCGELTVCRRA